MHVCVYVKIDEEMFSAVPALQRVAVCSLAQICWSNVKASDLLKTLWSHLAKHKDKNQPLCLFQDKTRDCWVGKW